MKKRYFSRAFSAAKKTTINGIKFDSKLEADKYIHLLTLEKIGKIKDLKLQVPFELLVKQQKQEKDYIPSIGKGKTIRNISYYADFVYTRTSDNQKVILDSKGRTSEVYKLKVKLLRACYPSYSIIEVYRDSKRDNFNQY